MRLFLKSILDYRRPFRQILAFLFLMVLLTLCLLMKTVSISGDHFNDDTADLSDNNRNSPWRPFVPLRIQQRIQAWTASIGFRSNTTLVNSVPQRWYLDRSSNLTLNFLKSEILGDVTGLWPGSVPTSDRIENQLLFRPSSALSDQPKIGNTTTRLRTIYLPDGLNGWGIGDGKDFFHHDNCPVSTCQLTTDWRDAKTADAVLFKHRLSSSFKRAQHPPSQIWILYLLESPFHTPSFEHAKESVNWTATYRADSDLVTPYEKFVLYDPAVRQKSQSTDFARSKSGKGKVAWFVSNCAAVNRRLDYAKELSKYISVDIFGSCGNMKCGRGQQSDCREMLRRDYKFYLAFENSNCRWYITEKFWVNALQSDIVPIVMGAPPQDYEELAPTGSFIHVDLFKGPAELAQYLHALDANATAYNEYFQWRGTGQFINTHFFCRLCSMLHSNRPAVHYASVNEWWRGPSVCHGKK